MATTEPRDRILQSHTPALMVPRHGELPPMEKSGHRYLVAEDGLWLEVKRPWLHARIELGAAIGVDAGFHQMPFGQLERSIAYAFEQEHLTDLQNRFLVDAKSAMPNEFAAWGVYDAATGELRYQPLIAIEASAGGITFHRPQLGPDEHLALDLHSHGATDAFFSTTDDEDDAGEVKLSVVVGRLSAEPMWATRLCLLGLFITEGGE